MILTNRTWAFLIASALTVLALGAAPVSGQEAPPTPKPGQGVVGLYVAGDALGGAMSPEAPTGETSTRKSLIASAINPGAGTVVRVGTFQPAEDLTLTSDVGVSLWLVSATATAYDQIQARLVGTGLTGVTGNTPLTAPVVVQTTPTNLRLGLPAMGQTIKAGTAVNFELVLFGVGAGGTATDLFLLYNSKTHATGLTFATTAASAFPVASSARPVYLSDKSLTLEVPTDTADKSATIAGSACTGTCMGSVPAWTWGKVAVDEGFTVSGESVLTLWLSIPAGAMRGFSATLTLDKTAFGTSQGGTLARSWSGPAVVKFVFVFATRGAEVPAGAEITLAFQAWTTADTPAGDMKVLYGSVARPSSILIPTLGAPGGAAVAALNLTAETTTVQGEQGKTATALLNITNPGVADANVTLNASGDFPVSFTPTGPYLVGGNNSTLVTLEFDLGAASAGDNGSVWVQALVDGVEVGNLTYAITIIAPVNLSATPSNGTSTTPAAAPKTAPEEDTAAPTALWAAAALVAGLGVARRRRA